MKHAIAIILLATAATAQTMVPRIIWSVETSALSTKRLDLNFGETVDLEVTFLNYSRPMNIDGAAVTLHATTNGMPEGTSFQISGTAYSSGLAKIRLPVDSWIPQGMSNFPYTIEVVQTNSARILRARGQAFVTGTSAASVYAPIPASIVTNLLTKQTSFTVNGRGGQLATNNAIVLTAADLGAASLVDLGAHTNLTNNPHHATAEQVGAPSISALYTLMATSRIERLYESPTAWYSLSSNVITRSSVEVSTTVWAITNAEFSLSVFGADYPWRGGTENYNVEGGSILVFTPNIGSGGEDSISWQDGYYQAYTVWDRISQVSLSDGYAFLSPVPVFSTNVTSYYLQTNLVPPETWSAADQTNWTAEGGVGEAWVIELANLSAWTLLNFHTSPTTYPNPHPMYATGTALTNAVRAVPAWIVYTNATGSVTLTNQYEAPIYLHGTGAVSMVWTGLRSPAPVYFVARGMSSLSMPGAYFLGGGSYQTNMSNHFIVWAYGTNVFVNAVTTSED